MQARASAQQMATLTLEAKDLPEDEVATVSEDGTPVVVAETDVDETIVVI